MKARHIKRIYRNQKIILELGNIEKVLLLRHSENVTLETAFFQLFTKFFSDY